MTGYNDLFQQINRGTSGVSVVRSSKTLNAHADDTVGRVHAFEDADIDAEWADKYFNSNSTNPYYDYFFSGQDIKLYIDGAEDSQLPVMTFGFNVEQKKTPVYGLWSYTYDAVMRGTRLISGTFTLSTSSTDYMRRVLTKAATSRADRGFLGINTSLSRPLTEDDENLDKYWGKNIDPNLGAAHKNIFSVHPPFNFVVVYGIQSTQISPTPEGTGEALSAHDWNPNFRKLYGSDYALSMDVNERIVQTDSTDRVLKFTIEACELQSLQIGYSPDGSVCQETYQFFARDLVIPTSNA